MITPPLVDLAVFRQPAQSESENPSAFCIRNCHLKWVIIRGRPRMYRASLFIFLLSATVGLDMPLHNSFVANCKSGRSNARKLARAAKDLNSLVWAGLNAMSFSCSQLFFSSSPGVATTFADWRFKVRTISSPCRWSASYSHPSGVALMIRLRTPPSLVSFPGGPVQWP